MSRVDELNARIEELERLLAERSHLASQFRDIVESSPNMIFITQRGRVVYANKRCEEVIGYSVHELTSPDFNFRKLIDPESFPMVERAYRRHMAGEDVDAHDYALLKRDGGRIVGMHTTRLIEFEGASAILGIITDVTARDAAERALRESEERYRTLVETSPDAIFAVDLESRFVMVNAQGAKLLGYDSPEAVLASGITAIDTVVPEQRERVSAGMRETIASPVGIRLEFDIVRLDGTVFATEITASVIRDAAGQAKGFVAVMRDLTERRRAESERQQLEAQIQHTQRLESLGVLAGGIAHDFNNLLVGILGNASLARIESELSPRIAHALEQIEIAARRAADLTKQMLAYSGRGTFARRIVVLRDLVQEMAGLLEVSIPKTIRIEYDYDQAPAVVEADPGQLQQVIMNLITNAGDAMETTGGVIRVAVETADSEELARRGPYMRDTALSGAYVCVTVSDSGAGMDAATIDRIFDPFFTTKFAGRGLGLAAVLGIVRAHDGALGVESEPGKGTTFRVLFPAAQRDAARRGSQSGEDAKLSVSPRSGTVLVVDDEELVLTLAHTVLSRSGYDVVIARDGREAVTVAEKRGGELVAVLLDLTMPVMDGFEACDRIRSMHVGLPIILSSGYSKSELADRFVGDAATCFIQKPYDPHELIRLVDSVAHSTETPSSP